MAMSLQDSYFVLGIIFFIFSMVMYIAFIIGAFIVWKRLNELQKEVQEKIDQVKEAADQTPEALTRGVGVLAIGAISMGLRKIFDR